MDCLQGRSSYPVNPIFRLFCPQPETRIFHQRIYERIYFGQTWSKMRSQFSEMSGVLSLKLALERKHHDLHEVQRTILTCTRDNDMTERRYKQNQILRPGIKHVKYKKKINNKKLSANHLKMDNFYAQTVLAECLVGKKSENKSVKPRCSTCASTASTSSQTSVRSTSYVTKTQMVKRLLANEHRVEEKSKAEKINRARTDTANSIYSMEYVFWAQLSLCVFYLNLISSKRKLEN